VNTDIPLNLITIYDLILEIAEVMLKLLHCRVQGRRYWRLGEKCYRLPTPANGYVTTVIG